MCSCHHRYFSLICNATLIRWRPLLLHVLSWITGRSLRSSVISLMTSLFLQTVGIRCHVIHFIHDSPHHPGRLWIRKYWLLRLPVETGFEQIKGNVALFDILSHLCPPPPPPPSLPDISWGVHDSLLYPFHSRTSHLPGHAHSLPHLLSPPLRPADHPLTHLVSVCPDKLGKMAHVHPNSAFQSAQSSQKNPIGLDEVLGGGCMLFANLKSRRKSVSHDPAPSHLIPLPSSGHVILRTPGLFDFRREVPQFVIVCIRWWTRHLTGVSGVICCTSSDLPCA